MSAVSAVSTDQPGTHECFFRRCTTVVPAERYHCDRHEEIIQRQRAIVARRNSERAKTRVRVDRRDLRELESDRRLFVVDRYGVVTATAGEVA